MFVDVDQTLMLVDMQGLFLYLNIFLRRLVGLIIHICDEIADLLLVFEVAGRTSDIMSSL